MEWGIISSKLIHIVTIVIVYLEPHKYIIVLPLDQVKKIISYRSNSTPSRTRDSSVIKNWLKRQILFSLIERLY